MASVFFLIGLFFSIFFFLLSSSRLHLQWFSNSSSSFSLSFNFFDLFWCPRELLLIKFNLSEIFSILTYQTTHVTNYCPYVFFLFLFSFLMTFFFFSLNSNIIIGLIYWVNEWLRYDVIISFFSFSKPYNFFFFLNLTLFKKKKNLLHFFILRSTNSLGAKMQMWSIISKNKISIKKI